MNLELHRKLIGDKVRNDAFYRALAAVIKPGKSVVADVGSGTGLMAFMASRLGAKHCHLLDFSSVMGLSRKLAKANEIKGCSFTKQASNHMKLREKVDVIVSETLGSFALEENITEILDDARRWLKPGGVIIPSAVRIFACPLITKTHWNEIALPEHPGFDLNFQLARDMFLNNMYVRRVHASDILPGAASVRELWNVDLTKKSPSQKRATVEWTLAEPLTISGFAVWWKAELAPGVSLSTAPDAPATHWDQIVLPVAAPVTFTTGDTLVFDVHCDTRLETGIRVRWQFRRMHAGKVLSTQEMDMANGWLE